jgi:hypothetical protein
VLLRLACTTNERADWGQPGLGPTALVSPRPADVHLREFFSDVQRGNTEGTPPRARASTTGYSSSGDSFFLPGFRARGFPSVPAVPASSLDGKEGVDGSSPSEGSAKTPHVGAFVFTSTCRFSRVRWVWSRLWSFQVENAPSAP